MRFPTAPLLTPFTQSLPITNGYLPQAHQQIRQRRIRYREQGWQITRHGDSETCRVVFSCHAGCRYRVQGKEDRFFHVRYKYRVLDTGRRPLSSLITSPNHSLRLPIQETTRDRTVATAANTLANRVSYVLGLNGPSLYVDTACSSSLTALHLALNAINAGECEAALVGGCQLNTKSVSLVRIF